MHEQKITQNLIKEIKEICAEKDILPTKINLDLGLLTTFKAEPIKYYYDSLKKDHKELKNSKIIIKEVKGKVECDDCEKQSEIIDNFMMLCQKCGSGNIKIRDGKDIVIRDITGEKNV